MIQPNDPDHNYNDHEARVKEFLKQAQANDPQRYREVCKAHLVLSEYQLRSRRKREIPLIDSDGQS